MKLSNRAQSLGASLTLEITAKAKALKAEGVDIISFGAGEPDFNTPDFIKNAAIEAINNNLTRYTAVTGINELKDSIINKFKKDNNLTYNRSNIVVSTGAKQSLSNAFASILNDGDEVMISVPYWVTYPELIKLNGGSPRFVYTKKENEFKFTRKDLEDNVNENTKAIVINTPSNPTGAIYSREELEIVAEFAKKHDLIIISDEIYEKLIYGGNEHLSIASLSEDAFNRTIVINGVSKTYAMTGWRLGYSACSEEIAKVMSRVQSHTTSNPNTITQYAALAALEGQSKEIQDMINEFSRRRDKMVELINKIENIECLRPLGAFYVMIDISKIYNKNNKNIKNSLEFSNVLLDEEKVAVVPGIAFGDDRYIRLSYATSMDNIIKGLDRINKFIKTL